MRCKVATMGGIVRCIGAWLRSDDIEICGALAKCESNGREEVGGCGYLRRW